MKFEYKNSKILFDKKTEKLVKYFIFLFFLSFLIINWTDISWIFNYKFLGAILSNLFQKSEVQTLSNFTESGQAEVVNFDYSEKENSLEIPRIDLLAPLIFVDNSNEEDLEKELNRGVVHFPTSALPGQMGQTIILGHSAPSGWPKINYDWVFSNLDQLNEGDEIFVHFKNKKFSYYVIKKIFLSKGEEVSEEDLPNFKNMLILITCWPPGKDLKRIAVEAGPKL